MAARFGGGSAQMARWREETARAKAELRLEKLVRKLRQWVEGKLAQFDADAAFAAKKAAKHADRQGFAAFLRKTARGRLADATAKVEAF